jgi:ATP-dependent Zn protease
MTSCASKKKITERSNEKTKREEVSSVSSITKNAIKTETSKIKTSEVYLVSKNDILELTQADPEKSITITNANGQSMSIKGANVTITKNENAGKIKDSINSKTLKTDSSSLKRLENKDISESASKKKRSSDVDVKRTSTWLWIILIIAVVAFIGYRYLKKLPGV